MRNGSKKSEAPADPFPGASNEELFFRSEVEPDCFTELVRRYRGELYATAARIVGPQNAEDVVQTAWLNMMRKRHQFLNYRGTSFIAWACVIVRNAALTQVVCRSAGQIPTEESVLEGLGGSEEPSDEQCAAKQLIARVLSFLGPDVAAVFHESFWNDLKDEEIGQKLGIPVGTVKSRLSRGRARAAKFLAPMCN